MAPSNDGNTEPTERTSLLRDESSGSKLKYSAPDNGITTSDRSSSNGHGTVIKNGDNNAIDEEIGEVEEDNSPLFDGNPDINMRLLFPAVALGVRGTVLFLLCMIDRDLMGVGTLDIAQCGRPNNHR